MELMILILDRDMACPFFVLLKCFGIFRISAEVEEMVPLPEMDVSLSAAASTYNFTSFASMLEATMKESDFLILCTEKRIVACHALVS